MNSRGRIRAEGHLWAYDDDKLCTTVCKRFTVTTWQFGNIHQCLLSVAYPCPGRDGNRVEIGLSSSRTCASAMRRGLAWIEAYRRNGPPSAKQVIAQCFKRYPELYRTRADVIEGLFFESGDDYKWLDGALLPTSQARHVLTSRERTSMRPARISDRPDLSDELRAIMREIEQKLEAEDLADVALGRPVPDDGGLREFCSVSPADANLFRVPPDVRPDWLMLAREAAVMLRNRSAAAQDPKKIMTDKEVVEEETTQARNRRLGAKACRLLAKQFGPWETNGRDGLSVTGE